MKKKIGILTYHRSVNYGAFMQAYSLSQKIAEDFPACDVEIVDYMSEETYRLYHKSIKNYLLMICKAQNFRKRLSYTRLLVQYIMGDRSQKDHAQLVPIFEREIKNLPLSSIKIITDNTEKLFAQIKGQYDVLVVGSDAVWNWQIRCFPNPYFLNGCPETKKMSYAASSYGQDYLVLNDFQRRYIADAWSKFSYVGVRDEPTENFVKNLCPTILPQHNCDPTVFLNLEDIPVEDDVLKDKLLQSGVDLDKPIIGVMGETWLAAVVKKLFGNQYQIVSVLFNSPNSDVYIEKLTPFEWSKVFRYFRVVFTHFFHGNLLALKNGTPTIPMEMRSSYNQTHDSKIRDFMKRLDLLECCYFSDEVDEKADEIRTKVQDMMENPASYTKMITDALAREALAYNSFREALSKAIEQ